MAAESESIFLINENEEDIIVLVEPTCEPYLLKKADCLRIEFFGGKIKDNIEITFQNGHVVISELGSEPNSRFA